MSGYGKTQVQQHRYANAHAHAQYNIDAICTFTYPTSCLQLLQLLRTYGSASEQRARTAASERERRFKGELRTQHLLFKRIEDARDVDRAPFTYSIKNSPFVW